MTHPADISPEDNALAAEYAAGLLTPEEVTAFEARLRTDPALFAVVAAWQSQFAAMAEAEVEEVAPPAALKARLEWEMFGEARPSFWSRLGVWRGLSFAGFASSLALAALVVFGPFAPVTPVDPQPAFVAQLAPVTGDAQFIALYDPDAATLRVQRAAGTPPEARVQELWLIAGEAAPVSLGLLADDGTTTIAVTGELQAILTQAVLAVSDEPPGGSPTGAPTGDVLAAGPVISL